MIKFNDRKIEEVSKTDEEIKVLTKQTASKCKKRIYSVSYTHLDVYKRQTMFCADSDQ